MGIQTKHAAMAGLALLLILGGCAQVTVHSTVAGDGTISELNYQVNMSRTAYGYLEDSARQDGYDGVKDSILSDLNETERENTEVTEEYHGDQVTLTIHRTDFVPNDGASINITTEEGQIIYEDRTFVNESASSGSEDGIGATAMSGLAVDYYLEMPGEITDSNADSVDGNTAEWHASGSTALTQTRIYAVSDKPTFGSIPGFGPVVAVVGLLVTTLFLRKRAE